MEPITRDQVRDKLEGEDDFALVEVLDPDQFRKFHLPNAINVPIDEDFDDEITKAVPDKDTPVIVYCLDEECDASPKAARRMDDLGYASVYDYEAGKVDWKNAGLPVEMS